MDKKKKYSAKLCEDASHEGLGLRNVLLNNNSSKRLRENVSWPELYDMGVIGLLDLEDEEASDEDVDLPSPPTHSCKTDVEPLSPQDVYNDCTSADYLMYQKNKRLKPIDQDFFSYKQPNTIEPYKENLFERLSDEIVLQILCMLPQSSLARLATVSKRFRNLCLDETLWPRLDLAFKTLQPDSLYYILMRGVRALRLASSTIVSPAFKKTSSTLEGNLWKVEFLDLSDTHISPEDLEHLLRRCRNLRKLSIEACPVTEKVCHAIATNTQLDTLNMAMCEGVSPLAVHTILNSCLRLESVNMSWCYLSSTAIWCFCSLVSPSLTHLNLAGSLKSITNEDVEVLTKRCSGLIELDLSDCTRISGESISHIINNCLKLKVLSLSRCYKLSLPTILLLKEKTSLEKLNIFGSLFTEEQMKTVRMLFSRVAINEEMMSSIARPTVGIRRTSIWGIRCRE